MDYSLEARAAMLRTRLARERAARVAATPWGRRVAVPTADALAVVTAAADVVPESSDVVWDTDGYAVHRPVRVTEPWGPDHGASRTPRGSEGCDRDHRTDGPCDRLHRPYRERAERVGRGGRANVRELADVIAAERLAMRGVKGKSRMLRKAKIRRLEAMAAMLDGPTDLPGIPARPALPDPAPAVIRPIRQADYYGFIPPESTHYRAANVNRVAPEPDPHARLIRAGADPVEFERATGHVVVWERASRNVGGDWRDPSTGERVGARFAVWTGETV